jgi:hypothetical protein
MVFGPIALMVCGRGDQYSCDTCAIAAADLHDFPTLRKTRSPSLDIDPKHDTLPRQNSLIKVTILNCFFWQYMVSTGQYSTNAQLYPRDTLID